jgi:hypothetical protein
MQENVDNVNASDAVQTEGICFSVKEEEEEEQKNLDECGNSRDQYIESERSSPLVPSPITRPNTWSGGRVIGVDKIMQLSPLRSMIERKKFKGLRREASESVRSPSKRDSFKLHWASGTGALVSNVNGLEAPHRSHSLPVKGTSWEVDSYNIVRRSEQQGSARPSAGSCDEGISCSVECKEDLLLFGSLPLTTLIQSVAMVGVAVLLATFAYLVSSGSAIVQS